MAKVPAKASSSRLSPSNLTMGPKLVGLGVSLFVLTRVIKWLPLGLLGTWINGFLYPILLLSILAGAGLIVLKSKRN